ncbi:MAG: hypothetical protein RR357_03615 [Clostridia bacterium]
MKFKNNILILTSITTDRSAIKAIEAQFKRFHQNFNVIVIDEVEYGAQKLAERRASTHEKFMQTIPTLYRKAKSIKSGFSRTPISLSERRSLSRKLRGTAKRIYNAIIRFSPDVVLATTSKTMHEAVAAKRRSNFKFPIVGLMNRFTVDRSFYSAYADGYIVENLDMKNKLTSMGFPSNKIFVLGMPISENMPGVEYVVKKKSHLGLNMNPTVYLYGGKVGSREMLPVFELLLDQGDVINIIADCGRNRNLHIAILKMIDERKSQNVKVYLNTDGESENTLIAADCVMTVFDAELIYRSFLLNIPVIAYAPDNASEEADLKYLEEKKLIYYAHDYNFAIIGMYKIIQTNLAKQLVESASVRTSPTALAEICNTLANFSIKTKEDIDEI